MNDGRAFYNEWDSYAAQWLRNLIDAKHILPGLVNERSIKDVTAKDLVGYTRVHLFAGIGGWDYALRLAGWPDDLEVWTGSCPCQPFSCAGKRQGTADDRHLWPEMFRLIWDCRPPIIFGEQVASKDGLRWLDGVFADLESAGYTCGAADLCAAGINAPHIRQRLFWVAYASQQPCEWRARGLPETQAGIRGSRPQDGSLPHRFTDGGEVGRLAESNGLELQRITPSRQQPEHEQDGRALRLAHPEGNRRDQGRAESDGRNAGAGCDAGRMGNATSYNEQRDSESAVYGEGFKAGGPSCPIGVGDPSDSQLAEHPEQSTRSQCQTLAGAGRAGGMADTDGQRHQEYALLREESVNPIEVAGGRASVWDAYALVPCRDGRVRRIESGTFPLAHGLPRKLGLVQSWIQGVAALAASTATLGLAKKNRVGRLRGYGNSIVPELAAEFIRVCMDTYGPN